MAFRENPVINSPFEAPTQHYMLDREGQPTPTKEAGRRASIQIVPVASARRGAKQDELDLGDAAQEVKTNRLVNEIRERVSLWRALPLHQRKVTPETLRLLEHWARPDRSRKLFFCQREAVETLIYLTEVDPHRFRPQIEEANDEANPGLFRLASKMATGSGKTTVMAMIMAWHSINKARRPNSKQFTDAFLVISPGVTIRDRLRVLLPSDPQNVYEQLDLVPPDLLDGLRKARIVVTNYHSFMPRETQQLSKLNRQILGGRDGEKRFIETDGEMVARVAKSLMGRRDIVVLNDEAHHCYREKDGSGKEKLDAEAKDEAKRNGDAARVWISGIEAFDRVLGVRSVYDVSATPFFLRGSGYPEGTLFPWVVSDFGLLDAIESGIVKVPRLPTLDDSVQGDLPKFRNVYAEIKKAGGPQLPKKGRGKQAQSTMDPQALPALLQSAIEALHNHYEKTFDAWAAQPDMGRPPVFIVVCNNTATSKLIYDWMSGYDIKDPETGAVLRSVSGKFPLFQNIGSDGRRAAPMRSLLIDSEQLDAGDSLSDEFMAAAADEIEAVKWEMRRRGIGDPDKLSNADILREVMNTVGQPGKLGAEIRLVVSVSMLTEGWDANTVTHIMGVRAFGTQLLCEQVVGRGLRRVSYEVDPETGHFPVEYADVLGIPFTFSASGAEGAPKPPAKITHVTSRKDRPDLQIRFPRVEGYRVVFPRRPLVAEWSPDSAFELNPDMIPVRTEVEPVIGDAITLDLGRDADQLRLKSVVFDVAGYTLRKYFRDEAGEIEVWRFPELVRITDAWFANHLRCRGACRPQFMKWRQFADQAADKIYNAVVRSLERAPEARELRLPILDNYNPEGSTRYVDFNTSKEKLFSTTRSPITHVVADGDWELGFAEAMERLDGVVLSYAKNHNLHFEVPYAYEGEMRRYRPDYIVRVNDRGDPDDALNLVVEVKGQRDEGDAAKADAMVSLWIPSVNNSGRFGRWAFLETKGKPYDAERLIRQFAGAPPAPPPVFALASQSRSN